MKILSFSFCKVFKRYSVLNYQSLLDLTVKVCKLFRSETPTLEFLLSPISHPVEPHTTTLQSESSGVETQPDMDVLPDSSSVEAPFLCESRVETLPTSIAPLDFLLPTLTWHSESSIGFETQTILNTPLDNSQGLGFQFAVGRISDLDVHTEDMPLEKSAEQKRKRGRPFGKKTNGVSSPTDMLQGESMKRKMGRPFKNKINGVSSSTEILPGEPVKRKMGRPFKNKIDGVSSPTEMLPGGKSVKKKRGRPFQNKINGVSFPTEMLPGQSIMKRKMGRPFKNKINGVSSPTSEASSPTKMSRGEPVKRKRGRPSKKAIDGVTSPTSTTTPTEIVTKDLVKKKVPAQEKINVPVALNPTMKRFTESPRRSARSKISVRCVAKEIEGPFCISSDDETKVPEVALHQSVSLPPALLDTHIQNVNLDPSILKGSTAASDSSSKQGGTEKDAVERGQEVEYYVGGSPVPMEYQKIYNEIKNRHGHLENSKPVGEVGSLSYTTMTDLLKMVQRLNSIKIRDVTRAMIESFERTVSIGKMYDFNVEWLDQNLRLLRDRYAKYTALNVDQLEQEAQRCNACLKAAQEVLEHTEEAYTIAKSKFTDLVKSRDNVMARLVEARDSLNMMESEHGI